MDDAPAQRDAKVRVIMCLTFDRRAPPQEIEAAKVAIIACRSVLHSVELTGTYDFMFEAEVPDMAAYNAQLSIARAYGEACFALRGEFRLQAVRSES